MSRALPGLLSWIALSERFMSTAERAQYTAYSEGAPEVSVEHLFAALLEDVDAVFFAARYDINLGEIGAELKKAAAPASNFPRLTGPVTGYGVVHPAHPPHLEIPASPPLRRVMAMASALAENLNREQLDGALTLEAILHDGRSQAAAILRAHYAKAVAKSERRLPALPGAAAASAKLSVQAPLAVKPEPAPEPRKPPLQTFADQLVWLQAEALREIHQDQNFKLIEQRTAYSGGTHDSYAASLLRSEADRALAQKPISRVQNELGALGASMERLETALVKMVAELSEVSPIIYQRFLREVPDRIKSAVEAAVVALAEERARQERAREAGARLMEEMFARSASNSGHTGNLQANGSHADLSPQPMSSPSQEEEPNGRPIIFQLPRSQAQERRNGDANGESLSGLRGKTALRLNRIWALVAAAGATMVSLSFIL